MSEEGWRRHQLKFLKQEERKEKALPIKDSHNSVSSIGGVTNENMPRNANHEAYSESLPFSKHWGGRPEAKGSSALINPTGLQLKTFAHPQSTSAPVWATK